MEQQKSYARNFVDFIMKVSFTTNNDLIYLKFWNIQAILILWRLFCSCLLLALQVLKTLLLASKLYQMLIFWRTWRVSLVLLKFVPISIETHSSVLHPYNFCAPRDCPQADSLSFASFLVPSLKVFAYFEKLFSELFDWFFGYIWATSSKKIFFTKFCRRTDVNFQ